MLFINGGNNSNMIKKVKNEIAITYSYDYANRLTKVRNQHFEVSYGYDGYGRKVYRWLRYIPTEEGVTIPEPEFSSYIWDSANILLEFPQNGRVRNPIEYLQGADGLLSAHYLSRLHDGEEKLIEHTTNFYHYDALGSTVNLTDQNGSVTITYKYDAFGAVTKEENGIGGKKNCYKFVGRYGMQDDPAANLLHMRARYYNPTIGRFITKDPISEPMPWVINYASMQGIFPQQNFQLIANQNLRFQATFVTLRPIQSLEEYTWVVPTSINQPQQLHSYVYVQNNPVNWIDPMGYFQMWICHQRTNFWTQRTECRYCLEELYFECNKWKWRVLYCGPWENCSCGSGRGGLRG
jgi:RHS repeat-associated protein